MWLLDRSSISSIGFSLRLCNYSDGSSMPSRGEMPQTSMYSRRCCRSAALKSSSPSTSSNLNKYIYTVSVWPCLSFETGACCWHMKYERMPIISKLRTRSWNIVLIKWRGEMLIEKQTQVRDTYDLISFSLWKTQLAWCHCCKDQRSSKLLSVFKQGSKRLAIQSLWCSCSKIGKTMLIGNSYADDR